MIIDLQDNNIVIHDDSSCLDSIHVSQISFWGFRREGGGNIYSNASKNTQISLLKLLDYFDKEGIEYCLSERCQVFLEHVRKITADFEKLKDLGRVYKDGEYEAGTYTEFAGVVRTYIPRKLKDHQLKAALHLYLVQNGANFSVPGSGKTAVVLCVYEILRKAGKVNLLFVVGPPSCFAPWRREFNLTLGREANCCILAGGNRQIRKAEYYATGSNISELYLTTFQSLLNDKEDVAVFLSQPGIKAFLVVDEAHYIKQLGGSWAQAVLNLAGLASRRCVLTGTPIPRSFTDTYNLFDYIWPNENPIPSEDKTRISMSEEAGELGAAKAMLERRIGPFFYRVRKSELGLLPPRFHEPHVIRMNPVEKKIYDAVENRIRDYSKEDYLVEIELVRRLQRGRIVRLRQAVSYAKLLASALQDYDEDLLDAGSEIANIILNYDSLEVPAKLEHLMNVMRDYEEKGQKVVIWANFVGTLRLISEHLSNAGLYCKLIYGETPVERTSLEDVETREKIIDEFIDEESGLDILIANPAVCAESISLHKTCYNAIYYDLSYNCAQYLQSLDRIHRVGGSETKEANYYFLQYSDSLDQDIKANLDRKVEKMNYVVEQDYGIYSLDMFEDEGDLEAYEKLFGNV